MGKDPKKVGKWLTLAPLVGPCLRNLYIFSMTSIGLKIPYTCPSQRHGPGEDCSDLYYFLSCDILNIFSLWTPIPIPIKDFFVALKSHILDGNGVRYCSYWSEGSKTTGFCPQGPQMAAQHGTSNDSARDLEWQCRCECNIVL